MSQNLIDLHLSPEDLAQIDEGLTVLENVLSPLRGLDAHTRRRLTKMGEKSELFCREAVAAFSENSQLLPRNFDLAAYQRDLETLDALRPCRLRLARLVQLLEDAEMALGSDLMTASLEGYAVLKVSGKGMGLDSLRRSLAKRFHRRRGQAVEPAAEPS